MKVGGLVFVSFGKCCWVLLAWGEVRSRLVKAPSLLFVGCCCCCCCWIVPPLSFGSISLAMQHDCAASTTKTDIDVASLLLCFPLAPAFAVLRARRIGVALTLDQNQTVGFTRMTPESRLVGWKQVGKPCWNHTVFIVSFATSRLFLGSSLCLFLIKHPHISPILTAVLTMPSSHDIVFILILVLDLPSTRLPTP